MGLGCSPFYSRVGAIFAFSTRKSFLTHTVPWCKGGISGISFYINISAQDLHAMVTQIKTIQNTVCSALNATRLYIDNIANYLYLDPWYNSKLSIHPGANIPTCSFAKALTCDTLGISKEVFLIDSFPQTFQKNRLELEYRLHGSSCLKHYRFNLSVWVPEKHIFLSYFHWTYLTVSKWIFREKHSSFQIQLNVSCYATCAKDCNLSVQLQPVVNDETLHFSQGLVNSFSAMRNGSWEDANEYCHSIGSSLITPRVGASFDEFLSSFEGFTCSKIFIGLHKKDKVRC